MNRDTFNAEVEKIVKSLSPKKLVLFSWRCALYALPFIGCSKNLYFWNDKQLFSVFYAVDIGGIVNIRTADAAYAARAARAARAVARAADDAAARAAGAVARAARAARAAGAVARAAADAADAARADDAAARAAAADAAAAAYVAAYVARAADDKTFDATAFLSLLLNDLRAIKVEKKDITGLYGSIWTDFLDILEKADCTYWSSLYSQLFSKNFVLDDRDIRKMEQRINVPREIREMGAVEVGKYLTEMETQGAENLNEARVIILGEKGAGKTCLARKLKNPDADMTTDDDSTAGVDTTIWQTENCTIHIWDFAGHVVTHAVHKFFLSERCVYILIYDGRTEERNRLFYWLDYVKNYGRNSQVFILVNERDRHRIELTLNDAKRAGYNIHEPIYFFSIRDDREKLLSFREDILRFIQNNPSWDCTKIPKEDYQIKKELESLFVQCKGTEKQEWITYTDFEGIVQKISQKDDSGIKSTLRRLHALGISLWYEDMEENNMLILNPEWICNGIYSIINWVHNHKRYDITIDEFSEVFASESERYPEEKYRFLFALMKKYELAYTDERSEGKRLIIPHLLQEDCPPDLPDMSGDDVLSIRFTPDEVLTYHTISRFIVKNNEDIKRKDGTDMVWRYGVILENENGNIGLIEEKKNIITVSVKGPDKTAYITRIQDSLIEIFETYKTTVDDKFEKIIENILQKDYKKAFNLFKTIKDKYSDLINEAFFLNDLFDVDGKNGDIIPLYYKAKLWQLISRNSFSYSIENKGDEKPQETETKKLDNTKKIEKTITPTFSDMNSYEKGEALEQATIKLFQMLFELDEVAENEIITMVRKQKSGEQFGFDIKVKYRTQNGDLIECRIECKNTKELKHEDIAPKIDQLRRREQSFEHFIIINPNADSDNNLDDAVAFWNEEDSATFHTQIWSPESNVKGFFGLIKEVYELFYPNDSKNHPDNWVAEHRDRIIFDFKERLKPRINLPKIWREYINKADSKLLLSAKEDDFKNIYTSAVSMRALDGKDGFLLDHILNWLTDDNKCLFLLGDFGDGKTFFTYYLSRRLIEEYKQSPKQSWIPVRFSLQDFFITEYKDNSPVYIDDSKFIERSLESIKNDSFSEVCNNSKVLIILDGFDEMSPLMDEATITRNMLCLVGCYRKKLSSKNIKVLITSRKHFFENQQNAEFMKRLGNPNLIQIAPIPRKIVRDYLKKVVKDEKKLSDLLKVHDIIGLATKPLFLRMLTETVNNSDLPIDELTAAKIYDYYIKEVLNEKYHLLDTTPSTPFSNQEKVIKAAHDSLGKIAMHLYQTNKKYVLLDEAIEILGKESAEQLYALNAPTEIDNEDAKNKIAHRSLCITIKEEGSPITLCHRSMTEYLAAEMVYNMLISDENECKILFKSRILKWEMIYFIAQLINASNRKADYLKVLNNFVKETALFDLKSDRAPFERLGRNSINIIYKVENRLPGKQYNGLILDGADLMGANLSCKEFRDTSLKKANLCNVIFNDANFAGADISDAQFSETYEIISVFYSVSDKYIYVLYADTSIWKWDIDGLRQPEKLSLKLNGEKYSHIVVFEQDRISAIEQGKVNQISFYHNISEDSEAEGCFKINDELKIISISSEIILLEKEINEKDIHEWHYITHNILDHEIYFITSVQQLICSPLGTQGMLTYYESSLKVDDSIVIATCDNIINMNSYNCENNSYIIGFCDINGNISIAMLKKSDEWHLDDIYSLTKFDKVITHLSFADENTLIVVVGSEEIYVLRFGSDFKLIDENTKPLKLELLCAGMKIDETDSDGKVVNKLKSNKEYDLFHRLINMSSI